jgi:hypothetical protein
MWIEVSAAGVSAQRTTYAGDVTHPGWALIEPQPGQEAG